MAIHFRIFYILLFYTLVRLRRERCGYGVAVEVEGDGAVEVGAVDVDSGGLRGGRGRRALGRPKEVWKPTEITAKFGLHGCQNFWRGGCGAAVMAYF